MEGGMDRRDFLKGVAAAGIAAVSGEEALAQEAPKEAKAPSFETMYPHSEQLGEVKDIAEDFVQALKERFAATRPEARDHAFWQETDRDLAAYALAYAKTYFQSEFSNSTPVPVTLFSDAMDSLYEAADEIEDESLRREMRRLFRKEKVAAKGMMATVPLAPAPAAETPPTVA